MNWEPWTGCYQISDGCANCYFYGPYAKRYGQNTILKTDKFNWPIRRNKRVNTTSKGIRSSPPALPLTFSCPKRTNGGEKSGP